MIEITFGHRATPGIIIMNKISIGHGIPEHGQTDYITLITEEWDRETGMIAFATLRWKFGLYELKKIIRKIK